MLIHNFNPVAISLFELEIRWYSLAYIFGILFGWAYAKKIIKKTTIINSNEQLSFIKNLDNLIPYLVFGIMLGGRLGYILFYNLEYYKNNILEIFYLWNGGMSFHGGLIGILVSTYFFSKKNKISHFYFMDIICLVAPIGIFFGRLANFINAELVGKKTSLPWGVIFPQYDNYLRHPSQIYEALLEGVVLFFILSFLAFKKKYIFIKSKISAFFLIIYSIFRIFSEIFREPDNHIGYIFYYVSLGQILSIIMLIFGLLLIFKKNEI